MSAQVVKSILLTWRGFGVSADLNRLQVIHLEFDAALLSPHFCHIDVKNFNFEMCF